MGREGIDLALLGLLRFFVSGSLSERVLGWVHDGFDGKLRLALSSDVHDSGADAFVQLVVGGCSNFLAE